MLPKPVVVVGIPAEDDDRKGSLQGQVAFLVFVIPQKCRHISKYKSKFERIFKKVEKSVDNIQKL